MTQVGEPIDIGEFISKNEEHSESTCPWHKKSTGSSKKLDKQDGDEDAHGSIPDNSGKKLGANLTADSNNPPGEEVYQDKVLSLTYKHKGSVAYKEKGKTKKAFIYVEDENEEEWLYDLQYAPHHLIPGNESLKGSQVVPYMGDDDAIENFKKSESSKIKDGFSIDYDVNNAGNGVWLPSPYALSMSNEWPSIPGIEAIKKKRNGIDLAESTEDFKEAYVAQSIEVSNGRQFHMRHVDYSRKVQEILDAIGEKLARVAVVCPVTKNDNKNSEKLDPPYGLSNRLNALSERLAGFLIGPVWRPPLFTDELTKQYAEDLKKAKKATKVKPII